jgi:hypothetical protein
MTAALYGMPQAKVRGNAKLLPKQRPSFPPLLYRAADAQTAPSSLPPQNWLPRGKGGDRQPLGLKGGFGDLVGGDDFGGIGLWEHSVKYRT